MRRGKGISDNCGGRERDELVEKAMLIFTLLLALARESRLSHDLTVQLHLDGCLPLALANCQDGRSRT